MSTHSTWSKRVDEWRKSGLTAARFCEGRDFKVSSLRCWSSKLGRATAHQPPVTLARVLRMPAAAAAPTRIRIEVDQLVLDLPADIQPDFAAALVHALRNGDDT